MTATESFRVVDQRTGKPVTEVSYFTAMDANLDIAAWWVRFHRGGRRDITRELLFNLRVRREDELTHEHD